MALIVTDLASSKGAHEEMQWMAYIWCLTEWLLLETKQCVSPFSSQIHRCGSIVQGGEALCIVNHNPPSRACLSLQQRRFSTSRNEIGFDSWSRVSIIKSPGQLFLTAAGIIVGDIYSCCIAVHCETKIWTINTRNNCEPGKGLEWVFWLAQILRFFHGQDARKKGGRKHSDRQLEEW